MSAKLSITDRYRLRELTLLPSQVVPDGRLMWLDRHRKIIGHGTLDKLAVIPRAATAVMLSIADHQTVIGEKKTDREHDGR